MYLVLQGRERPQRLITRLTQVSESRAGDLDWTFTGIPDFAEVVTRESCFEGWPRWELLTRHSLLFPSGSISRGNQNQCM